MENPIQDLIIGNIQRAVGLEKTVGAKPEVKAEKADNELKLETAKPEKRAKKVRVDIDTE